MRYSETELAALLGQFEELGVLVVSADPLARSGLALLLSGQVRLSVRGQLGPEDEVANQASQTGSSAVIFDLGPLPHDAAIEGLRKVARTSKVLALVATAQQANDALAVGARGALLRDSDGARLAAAVRAIAAGIVPLDPASLQAWVEFRHLPLATAEPLTARERQVLELLSQGLANKEIAQRLSISDHTAKFHVNAILAKLGAESRTEAVVRAARLGWVVL